jgi:hypothetical protein
MPSGKRGAGQYAMPGNLQGGAGRGGQGAAGFPGRSLPGTRRPGSPPFDTASVVTYLLLTVAVILGAIVLSDHITMRIVAGMLIVLAGIAISRHSRVKSGVP